jgi:hypothetical protein
MPGFHKSSKFLERLKNYHHFKEKFVSQHRLIIENTNMAVMRTLEVKKSHHVKLKSSIVSVV